MEAGTKPSRTAVNANAAPAAPMQSGNASGVMAPGQTGAWEDLGGPTPDNYRPDDDSAKLNTPGATLKQVKDVVNSRAVAAEDFEYDDEEELFEASEKEDEEDEDEEEKPAKGKKSMKDEEDEDEDEDEEEVKEEFDIDEDVQALLEGEELSEEFQEKARTIFEAAINSRVASIKEALENEYVEILQEEVAEIKATLEERIDSYLEYVTDEWFNENALVIEQGIKSEMTESFLLGMKNLFEEHYVSIPEEKYDVVESMVEKLDEMETKLNEQIEKNVFLNKRLAGAVAEGIFEQVAVGLADTQRDKLASLAESVEFESEDNYREKLETLRESYFPTRFGSPATSADTLSEGVDVSFETHSNSMNSYLKTLSAFSK
jgi:hypothetical protein